MELKQLQYFYDVLRLHSFTAAARNNHVSQSAVSQKIKALETEMGVPLLHRNGREFTATAAGTKLYDYANAILSASEQAVKDVRKAAAGQELPRFTIGMIAATTFWEPVAAAQIFLQRHPQSNIAVLYGTNQQLQQSLLNHSIDIAFADNSAHFADYYQTHTVRRTYIGVETARSVLAALPSATLMPPLEEVTSTALSDVPCILQPLVTPLSGISQNEGASEQTAMEPAGVESLSMTYPSRFPQTAHHASDDASMRTRQLADGTYFTVILVLLTRHVRQLWQAQVLQAKGIRGKALAKPLELNPYIAERVGRAAAGFSAQALKNGLLELIDADYTLKTGQAGNEVLEHAIITLCQ